MLKRLASAAALAVSFSLLAVTPASATGCGLLGLGPCPTVPPAPPSPAVTPEMPVPAPMASPVPAPVQPPAPVAAPQALPAGDLPEAAAVLLQLVNQERAGAKLPALQSRVAIVAVAAGQSRAMAGRGDIWHNDAYFTSATRAALGARALGENVAMNGSVDDAHRRLMVSPGHRANILNAAFDAVGISVVRSASGGLFITQDFVDSRVAPKAKAKAKRAPSRRPAPRRAAPAARR